jgi:hypothetical protein
MEILLKLEFKILLDIVTCLVMFIWSFNKFYLVYHICLNLDSFKPILK